MKKHIENEPKPTFMPKIELGRRDPPNASNKTKILGCNSFLKRMEQSRRMKQDKEAILNRFCYNEHFEKKITKPVAPQLRVNKGQDEIDVNGQDKFNSFIENKDKLVHFDASYQDSISILHQDIINMDIQLDFDIEEWSSVRI